MKNQLRILLTLLIGVVISLSANAQWQGPGVTGTGNMYFSNGNVGIGTTSPATKLHINGGSSSFPQLRIHENGGTNSLDFGHDGANTILQTNEGNILLSGGNVGIGTASPAAKLHISSSDFKDFLVLDRTSRPEINNVFHLTPSWDSDLNDQLRISTDNIDIISFEETGNVGIGTTNPSGLLHLKGSSG